MEEKVSFSSKLLCDKFFLLNRLTIPHTALNHAQVDERIYPFDQALPLHGIKSMVLLILLFAPFGYANINV